MTTSTPPPTREGPQKPSPSPPPPPPTPTTHTLRLRRRHAFLETTLKNARHCILKLANTRSNWEAVPTYNAEEADMVHDRLLQIGSSQARAEEAYQKALHEYMEFLESWGKELGNAGEALEGK